MEYSRRILYLTLLDLKIGPMVLNKYTPNSENFGLRNKGISGHLHLDPTCILETQTNHFLTYKSTLCRTRQFQYCNSPAHSIYRRSPHLHSVLQLPQLHYQSHIQLQASYNCLLSHIHVFSFCIPTMMRSRRLQQYLWRIFHLHYLPEA